MVNVIERSLCYVITGAVGSGKTSLIRRLCKGSKFSIINELAEEIIQESLATDESLVPWRGRNQLFTFEEVLLKRRIQAFLNLSKHIC